MATAAQSESEASRKLARLRAAQQSESVRRKEAELAEKEREKHERWDKVLENHEKQVKAATQPRKPAPVAAPAKPKILQPVYLRIWKNAANKQQRSMTFKKLLKEAAKVDSSTFKLGPKVRPQSRVPEKPPPIEKSEHSAISPVKPESRKSPPQRSSTLTSTSTRPTKSVTGRATSSVPRTASPSKPLAGKVPVKQLKSTFPAKPVHKPGGMDTKSRLRESFVPNELIPLAQGPRRDLRTIEEIQNDLWKKKGKNYPSVTGKPKEPMRKPVSPPASRSEPAKTKKTIAPTKEKRLREEKSSDDDSFIASSNEEEVKTSEKFDYRAEIRAMFARKGSTKVTYSDDDSDMEATGLEMAREEAQAARLARMEDDDEERREQERIREKKKRKLEASKKKSVK
jgi:protein SPT2